MIKLFLDQDIDQDIDQVQFCVFPASFLPAVTFCCFSVPISLLSTTDNLKPTLGLLEFETDDLDLQQASTHLSD